MESGFTDALPLTGSQTAGNSTSPMANMLIIDDDQGTCHVLSRTAQRMGHSAISCGTLSRARELLRQASFDVILLDVYLPDGNGLDAIEEFAAHSTSPEIVVITGLGAAEDAEQAIKRGAWDYIEKSSPRRMAQALEQVLRYREERLSARPQAQPDLIRHGIMGDSHAIQSALATVGDIAPGEAHVIISGETGTGKEAFARAIHNNSPRRNGPFVIVDCASLPDTLAESILFGHVRGAFTGATHDSKGLVKEAHGGTLFLDEVGELPIGLQATFLRVLQQRTYRPVGATAEESSDFRLVAATNRDLGAMVQDGAFRSDLLFRLRGAQISLPPLRERKEDISPLATHYIEVSCQRRSIAPKVPSQGFLDVLNEYDWPGNVRELVNAVDYAVNAAFYEETLFHAHLPRELRASVMASRLSTQAVAEVPALGDVLPSMAEYRKDVLHRAEQHYLEQLMQISGNDIQNACDISGLSQSRLYALLRQFKMPTPGWKK